MARVQHTGSLETKIPGLLAKAIPLVPVKGSVILYSGAKHGNESYLLDQGGIQRYWREIEQGTPVTKYERMQPGGFLRRVHELPYDAQQQVLQNLTEYLKRPQQTNSQRAVSRSPTSTLGL